MLYVLTSLRGAAAAHTFVLAEGLRRLGWRVVLAAPEDSPERVAQAHSTFDSWERVPFDLRPGLHHLRALDGVVRRYAPDIVHAHGVRAGYLARLWCAVFRRGFSRRKRGSPPLIYTVHGLAPESAPGSLWRWLGLASERILNRAAGRVVVASRSEMELAAKHRLAPEEKLVLIENAIDPTPFRQPWSRQHARASWQIGEEAFVVGTLGPLEREKAVHVLVDAAQQLHRLVPHAQVVIGGEGHLRKDLEARVEQAELSNTVRFLGGIADPALFYRALDVFCLTSTWEGLPLVILEAAAVDVPIVATRTPGISDLLTHEKSALLVAPDDPSALAEAILRFQRDPAFAWKLASEATRALEPFFRPDEMCHATADLYTRVMREKASATPSRKASSDTADSAEN